MDADLIRKQLNDCLITSERLLAGTKLVDESSRDSADYLDPNHFPFYYHLGKQLTPKKVFQIGARLGLVGCCFLSSCKTVEEWMAMDHGRDLTSRIIAANLKLHTKYKDDIMPGPFQCMGLLWHTELEKDSKRTIPNDQSYDLCFLSDHYEPEKQLVYLKFLWNLLNPEGLLVADYINSDDVFHEFCRVSNREPVIFNTRYGIGIIKK